MGPNTENWRTSWHLCASVGMWEPSSNSSHPAPHAPDLPFRRVFRSVAKQRWSARPQKVVWNAIRPTKIDQHRWIFFFGCQEHILKFSGRSIVDPSRTGHPKKTGFWLLGRTPPPVAALSPAGGSPILVSS